eukprot:scaffold4786_cov198-Amphora_coffeaeformis.AAC.17
MVLDGQGEGGCGDPCGWMAAAIAALSYGSYGVPIKATLDLDVHPLVLQSYKTAVLFVFSWWFVVSGQEEARWTGYGIVSGFLWVLGGSCGILAIRNAGMAVAVGTWASVMVLVNFVWGILVFREPIHSFSHTCIAFAILCCGLVGMSKYSTSASSSVVAKEGDAVPPHMASKNHDDHREEGEEMETLVQSNRFTKMEKECLTSRQRRVDEEDVMDPAKSKIGGHNEEEMEDDEEEKKGIHTLMAGLPLTQRESGILFALLNGLLAGSSLIPMHFAKSQGFMGRSYILSFGSGSMAANMFVWVVYFVYMHLHHPTNTKNGSSSDGGIALSFRLTYDLMPPFHWNELWFRGLMAGLLLTIGMFGAIFAIAILGQGVGNSLVQSKILISGFWGIFWFKEVKDPKAIGKWFASATLCVVSILWLSYERNSAISKGG